jgi:carboxypeptidase PM20D1
MKKVFLALLILVLLLVCILAVNTRRFRSRQIQSSSVEPVPIDESQAAENLASALRIPTVSFEDSGEWKPEPFLAFHQYLETTFPKVHQTLKREIVSEYSLLYTWQGKSANLKPILLLAHMDVVPVANETLKEWTHPPFEGKIDGGYIWGRGAMDDKAGVLGILQATEMLIEQGYQPDRTLYFAFGHDEELAGLHGAVEIASLLGSRGVQPEFVLDEGGLITNGFFPGVSRPIALVGIAEKGFLSLKLSVSGTTGHSSMPPKHTSIGILSKAIEEIENHPFPSRITGATRSMFEYLGPEMPSTAKIVLANLWLLQPLVKMGMQMEPGSAAMVRTTTAVTVIRGGVKDNVLPGEATAVVNFRILPGDTSQSVIEHVRSVIHNPAVKVETSGLTSEPSFESDADSPAFSTIRNTIAQTFSDGLISPYLVVGATDSRHYAKLTHNIFRFLPFTAGKDDMERVHGINERISVKDFTNCVRFYRQLILNSSK